MYVKWPLLITDLISSQDWGKTKKNKMPHALGRQNLLRSTENFDKFRLHHIFNLVIVFALENAKLFDNHSVNHDEIEQHIPS